MHSFVGPNSFVLKIAKDDFREYSLFLKSVITFLDKELGDTPFQLMEDALKQLNKHPSYRDVSLENKLKLDKYLRSFAVHLKMPCKIALTPDFHGKRGCFVRLAYYVPGFENEPEWTWRCAATFYFNKTWLSVEKAGEAWEKCVDFGDFIDMSTGCPYY